LWKRYFERHPALGIHFIIDREGRSVSSTDDALIANHAAGHNTDSIGVELVNAGDGREQFTPAQIDALVDLLRALMKKWAVPLDQVVGHRCDGQRRRGRSRRSRDTLHNRRPACARSRALPLH
jgi:N-acetylmuramoyl-L-alanine amidase